MPLLSTPPAGPASLSQNARTVLEKRYLVKDATGKPVEHVSASVSMHVPARPAWKRLNHTATMPNSRQHRL